nr:hypothetical protein [Tanacetum cinerariifolium]
MLVVFLLSVESCKIASWPLINSGLRRTCDGAVALAGKTSSRCYSTFKFGDGGKSLVELAELVPRVWEGLTLKKLLKDFKELAEYDQSTSTDRPIFLNDNEDHPIQNKESPENSSKETVVSKTNQEPPQDSDIHQLIKECSIEVPEQQKQKMEDTMFDLVKICHHKQFLCIHDDVNDLIESDLDSKLLLINSINSQRLDKKEHEVKNVEEQPNGRRNRAEKSLQNFRVIHKSSISFKDTSQISSIHSIAPIQSTKEPEHLFSMGYEHRSITPETESDEVTESNAENLLPIPSKCEDNDNLNSSNDESLPDEDVPAEEFKIYSNPLCDEDKINSDKLDLHCFNVESDFVESFLNRDTFIDFSSKFDFSSELAHIKPEIPKFDFDFEEEIRLIENLLYDNSFLRPPEELNTEITDTIIEFHTAKTFSLVWIWLGGDYGNVFLMGFKGIQWIETTKEETKILATVDGKFRTVSESSIRRNLKLNDEAGISSLPDAELFENLTLMGYNISPNQKQYTIRAKIAQSSALPPVADEPASPIRDDMIQLPRVTSLVADEGSMQQKLDELTALCTSLQSQQSEMIFKFAAQELEINRRLDEGEEAAKRVSDDTEEMETVLTYMDAAKSTPYTRRKGKEKMVESKTPKKKKVQKQIDVQLARELEEEMARDAQRMNKQIARDAEIARIHTEEELQIMIDGLDMNNETAGWKAKHFKGMTLEEIKEKFDPVWKQIQYFIPIGSKEEAERFKRKGVRLEQDSSKKLKTSEEVPEEKLKEIMELISVEEYFNREDLNQLWALVKETLNIRPASSDKEMELWVELKRLYEPDVEDQLWTHTQNLMHALVEWKLYDTCRVHHVTSKDKEIFMLVEKDYLLRKGLAIVMISYKLQVENYSQMANDLILKIYKIANCPRQQDD